MSQLAGFGKQALRTVPGVAVFLGGLAAAPFVARALDARGLPGGAIALGLVVLIGTAGLAVARTAFPSTRRARALARAAEGCGLRFRARFHIPASLRDLPSFADASTTTGAVNLMTGSFRDHQVTVFDRWSDSSGFEPTRWTTCAVARMAADCPALVIEPSGPIPVVGDALDVVGSESNAFGGRYRIRAKDRGAATAFVDALMMEWLLGLEGDWTFEAAGRWVMCSAGLVEPGRLRELLETLDGFLAHVPRVLGSLYPEPDPLFGAE